MSNLLEMLLLPSKETYSYVTCDVYELQLIVP